MQPQFWAGGSFIKRKKPVPFPLPAHDIEMLFDDYPVPYRYLYAQCYKFGQRINEALAVQTSDISYSQHKGKEVIVLNSLTEKNKGMPMRILPCRVDDKLSKELAAFYRAAPMGKLYPKITRQMAYNELSKRGKAKFAVTALVPHTSAETDKKQWTMESIEYCMHPHYLRHCCLTHKVVDEGFDILRLTTFAGWSTPMPAMVYTHLNWRELIG